MAQTLQGYLTQVRYLLHDAQANFYTNDQLIGYINSARERVVRDTGCLRTVQVSQTPCTPVAGGSNPVIWSAGLTVTTNSYVFAAAKQYGHKIILPYHIYARRGWSDLVDGSSVSIPLELEGMEIMIAITPIIRKTEEELDLLTNHVVRPVWKKGEVPQPVLDAAYLTYDQFDDLVKTLESRGINHMLINAVPSEEVNVIVPFIKKYVEENKR